MHNFDPEKLSHDVDTLKERLAAFEATFAPLAPLIPVLTEQYAQSVAGVGETQLNNVTIPGGDIGKYDAIVPQGTARFPDNVVEKNEKPL